MSEKLCEKIPNPVKQPSDARERMPAVGGEREQTVIAACGSKTSVRMLCRIALILAVVWIPLSVFFFYNMEKQGAYATHSLTPGIKYLELLTKAVPQNAKPTVSYEQWADAVAGCDPAGYIRAGLGVADGNGVFSRGRVGNQFVYSLYSAQGAGTPIFVGVMAALFGQGSVLPYFVAIFFMRYLCALGVAWITAGYTRGLAPPLVAGALCLFSPPINEYYSGIGLFSSEAASDLWFVAALIPLTLFWQGRATQSFRGHAVYGSIFGALIGIASYFRDSHSLFWLGGCFLLTAYSVVIRKHFKKTIVFCLLATIMFQAVELPWKIRNLKQTGNFAMSTIYSNMYACWNAVWMDYRITEKWCPNCASGLANYVDPDAGPRIIQAINADPKKGSELARKAYIRALTHHPLKAIGYKLRSYDKFWFGDREYTAMYAFCAVAMLLFFASMTLTGFMPEVHIAWLLLIGTSILVQYEHRLSFTFWLVSAPVAIGILVSRILERRSRGVPRAPAPKLS